MKRIIAFSAFLLLVVWACSSVPITGRKQLILVSDAEMNAMSLTSYKAFLDTNRVVSPQNPQAVMVKRVGDRIAKAAQAYFESVKMPDYLQDYKWQTELVESPQVNAWCMPGGKMVVYTGILPVTQTETGLAVVMGHEVSHAVAKHGAERLSNGMMAQGLLIGGQILLSESMRNKPASTRNLWNMAYGIGAPMAYQLGYQLPHGRAQESESDHLGLIFMAIAGYNPQEAVNFWGRMAQLSNGAKPPAILSTHPSDEQRIADIKRLMPEAMKYYTGTQRY
jgi:predicted Zn-dependent protease